MFERLKKTNLRLVLNIALSLMLLGYLVVALGFTTRLSSQRLCQGIGVEILDSARNGFVRAAEIERELGDLYTTAKGTPLSQIDLHAIEQHLAAIDKIEHVEAVVLTNDSVLVRVTPLVPVARIFEEGHPSYYINHSGKRFLADARYTMDVPVIRGEFSRQTIDPLELIPLAEYIENDRRLRDMFSMIDVRSRNDIYLVPNILGQVVEFGTVDNIPAKFRRLERFYKEVLPEKGWNFYDTISVKWNGQVVGTLARKHTRDPLPVVIETPPAEADEEGVVVSGDSTLLVRKPVPARQ
ncbi:MAG: cell division protein FtsQ/DivIB [Clostridium sp.]|nr:cell division protein FtsQ/DivIB [Clostridium sp.]